MLNWFTSLRNKKKPVADPSGAGQIQHWIRDAFAALNRGDPNAAAALLDQILRRQPDHADALYLSGIVAGSRNRPDEAIALIRRAIASDPAVASFHLSLANFLSLQGDDTHALPHYLEANTLEPDNVKTLGDLAHTLQRLGKASEAMAHFHQVLRIAPADLDACYSLGTMLQNLGRNEDAIDYYLRALAIDEGHAEARNNLGVTYQALGRLDESITCLRTLLERHPQHARGWNNLGCALLAARKVNEAEACLLRAIGLDPHYPGAHSNLALIHREQGRFEESMAGSRRVLELQDNPGERVRLATLLPVVARSAEEIAHWRCRFNDELDQLIAQGITLTDPLLEAGVSNFSLAYQPESDRRLQEKAAAMYARACPSLLYSAPGAAAKQSTKGRRIRVGFISKFMYSHSIGRTTRGLLAELDRNRFHVSALFVPPFVKDATSDFICEHADVHVVLPPTLEAARKAIGGLELDVLFYQDIGMDAYTYYLAFSRLARVQCLSFGHPDTTGIPNMDYFVSCENFETEDAAGHYSEQLFLLRGIGSLAYYYRPAPPAPEKNRAYFGLADTAHLYLCPQTLFKLHPDFDAILGGILRADPGAEIVLIDAGAGAWGSILRARFAESIPDVAHRIRFLPGMSPDDFVALLATGDVVLDTPYFNGMNTSLEAFSVGTPIVTMPTAMQRGRHTYGMYRHMGMLDCVVDNPAQYIELSVKLGTNKIFRDFIKEKILARCHLLYEDIKVVREFERFFETACQPPSDMP
ncbi:MAG TPA: tetratricopeptide repeat protein [Burkholderiaceae bacterium]